MSVPTFPSALHTSIKLPVTPPTFPAVPSHAHDEDWGQSIFQWGGELGPAPFVHFCSAPLISASTVFYICSPSTFRLSACGAHSVSPLISTFCPRSATRMPPLPLPTFKLHDTLPFPDMLPSPTRTQTSRRSPSQPGQHAQLHSETLTFRQYDRPLSPTLRKRDSTQPAHLPLSCRLIQRRS